MGSLEGYKSKMASRINRNSSHPLLRWWRSLDHTVYTLVGVLMVFGLASVMLASTGVSGTYELGSNDYHFAKKQLVFVILAFPLMTLLSTLNAKQIKRIGVALALFSGLAIVLTLFSGDGVKGANRWVRVFGVSLQPTELMKPALVILTAALLAPIEASIRVRNFILSLLALTAVCGLTFLQPDFGMVIMFCGVWFVQAYLSGVPLTWVMFMVVGGMSTVIGAYSFLPHVKSRIERFFDPSSGDSYQVDQAREALLSGGFLGRGPGEGVVKHHLPDAHTDFIFAVIAEEFGILTCLLLLIVFALIVFRGFSSILDQKDRFIFLAGFGLLTTFTMQTLVNIGVVMNVLPTTGMTLPFISYGGSAMIGVSFTMGFLLALTRIKGKKNVKKN
ncbi:MAG: cell division protein FtsW [bacterium]|jgi:cell division protein FtsW